MIAIVGVLAKTYIFGFRWALFFSLLHKLKSHKINGFSAFAVDCLMIVHEKYIAKKKRCNISKKRMTKAFPWRELSPEIQIFSQTSYPIWQQGHPWSGQSISRWDCPHKASERSSAGRTKCVIGWSSGLRRPSEAWVRFTLHSISQHIKKFLWKKSYREIISSQVIFLFFFCWKRLKIWEKKNCISFAWEKN